MKKNSWLPVIALTFAAFIFNTSEFVPIGLLSDIAADLSVTEAKAGLLITIYAWVVAATSLPLMLAASRMEYKRLLLLLVGVFTVSHIGSATATGYNMLMISRLGVACSHAVFWSIATPLAVRIAPEGHKSTALSIITAGTSVAMIIGMPLGRTIGLLLGWRATFMCIAALALAVFTIIAIIFPKVESEGQVSLRDLPHLFKNRALICIYVLTLVMISGHFTGYSYIEPFMAQVARFSENTITMLLMVFGIVGIVGSLIFSKYYDRHSNVFVTYIIIGITAGLFLMRPMSTSLGSTLALCILWGLAINFYNLTFQAEVIRVAPVGTDVAMSVYSGIYNIGIGGGAFIGGKVCTHLSVGEIGIVGGALSLAAMIFCLAMILPGRKNDLTAYNPTDSGR